MQIVAPAIRKEARRATVMNLKAKDKEASTKAAIWTRTRTSNSPSRRWSKPSSSQVTRCH